MNKPGRSTLSPIRRLGARLVSQTNARWTLLDQAVVSGSNFLTTIVVARNLGLSDFGVFSLAWIVALLFNNLRIALISTPMMTIGPKQAPEDRPAYYGSLVVQQALYSLAAFVLIAVGAQLAGTLTGNERLAGLGLPLAAAAGALQLQDFVRRYFMTRGDPTLAFFNDTMSHGGRLLLLVSAFAIGRHGVGTVLWVIAVTALAAAAAGARRMERIRFDAAAFRSTTRRHWRSASWMASTILLNWIAGNALLVAAGAMMGTASVGLLKAAQNIAGTLLVFFEGLRNIVMVEAARRLHREGPGGLVGYLRKVAWSGGGVTVLAGLAIGSFPALWLRLAYGEEFVADAGVLTWYTVFYVAMFFPFPLRSGLIAMEHTRPLFLICLLQTGFAVAAARPLIDWLGIRGVPVGMLVMQLMAVVLFFVAFRAVLRAAPAGPAQ